MRESVIEKYLVDKVKALGGEVRKVKWISRNSAPDRLVMLPDNTFWAELKAPK
ncbi:VRR-NUC domain-containing protein, partial [Acinetobacter baumannii]